MVREGWWRVNDSCMRRAKLNIQSSLRHVYNAPTCKWYRLESAIGGGCTESRIFSQWVVICGSSTSQRGDISFQNVLKEGGIDQHVIQAHAVILVSFVRVLS